MSRTNAPSIENTPAIQERFQALFAEHRQTILRRTDQMFARLMLFQWAAAIGAALWLSPKTWTGATVQTHFHVWAALFFGGAITLFPVYLAWKHSGDILTRHCIAVGQMLMSGLLIHLTDGRIETHFHVFGSLAFLSFYRDWRVLITATAITAGDHLLRGLFFPASVFGITQQETWRWLEHAGWVIFEDVFLVVQCFWGIRESQGLCERDARLEFSNADLERKVEARTLSLREANARLEALATTDPLTGLPNHRALVDIIDTEIERAHRYHRHCALLFLDLDHFKALNDGCGHAAGDTALEELGGVVRGGLRGIDIVGRWGGEEFIVLLPETDLASAAGIAERIRSAVAAHLFSSNSGMYLTCSVGVAAYPENAENRAALVSAADRAMYAAKKMGRNQVRVISDPAVQSLENEEMGTREDVTLMGTVEALASLVEARDSYTGEHTDGVEALAVQIAQTLDLSPTEVRTVGLVAKLHDIGKVAIPDAILQKPGRLTEEEWILMRQHPTIGADVVNRIPSLRIASPGIRGHHERWDGKGYPDGLAGNAIPLAARIITVADSYNAMTTTRPYREARCHDEAMTELRACTGSQFDPQIIHAVERLFAPEIPLLKAA